MTVLSFAACVGILLDLLCLTATCPPGRGGEGRFDSQLNLLSNFPVDFVNREDCAIDAFASLGAPNPRNLTKSPLHPMFFSYCVILLPQASR